MKSPFFFAVAALPLFAAGSAWAQTAPTVPAPGAAPPAASFVPSRSIEMRPEDKRPLLIKANERNPYARRSESEEAALNREENPEELKLREILSTLTVTGQSRGPNGLRILLGDIIVERGRVLPQLIDDQAETLEVIEVSDDSIVLGWLDIETGELTGKTIQVAYDLSPSVSYALHGQAAPSEGKKAERRMAVMRIGEQRKKQEAGMAARDPAADEIPRQVYEAGQ